jgi:hypothetical protein
MTYQGIQSRNRFGGPRLARMRARLSALERFAVVAKTVTGTAGEMARAGNRAGVRGFLTRWLRGPQIPPSSSNPPRPQAGARPLGECRRESLAHGRPANAGRAPRARSRARPPALTQDEMRSLYVLMTSPTLGEAWRNGWRLRVRCFWLAPGPKSGPGRNQVQCETSAELDLKTLVWTRGELFPSDQLEGRLKCPRCGSRRVTVVFEIPGRPKAASR